MTTQPIQSGSYDARYLVVSEAPGQEEDTHKRPFVGVSGWEVYRILEECQWIPPGSADRIIKSFHPWYDPEQKRWRISNPDFLSLDQILDESSIFITNVCHTRPPDNRIDHFFFETTQTRKFKKTGTYSHNRYYSEEIKQGIAQLQRDIDRIRPTFILALGGTALWALTGLEGITKWRASILRVENGPVGDFSIKLIPTYHPADFLREWPHRFVVVRDMKRALYERSFPEVKEKTRHYIIRPAFHEAMEWLDEQSRPERAQEPLGGDIETPWGWWNLVGHIACMGFSTSRNNAICIPLMCIDNKEGYWSPDEETRIVLAIRRLMTIRPMIFHKGIFDVMHIIRHWGFFPRWTDDTMIMQHTRFPGLLGAGSIDPVTGIEKKKGSSRSLVFCASMYCEHFRAWKDEGKNWNQKEIPDEDGWWIYNTFDTMEMYECFEVLRDALKKENLYKQYRFMMSLTGPVLDMMLRGFPFDRDLLYRFKHSVGRDIERLQQWIDGVCGHEVNTGSSTQLMKLFIDDLHVKKVMKGRGRNARPTMDKTAMEIIARHNAVLGPLCYAIRDQSHLRHFYENVLSIRIDDDWRARGEIDPAGTATLRFTVTEDCFGKGMNLQNINRDPEE